jgi:hypothetical protein
MDSIPPKVVEISNDALVTELEPFAAVFGSQGVFPAPH